MTIKSIFILISDMIIGSEIKLFSLKMLIPPLGLACEVVGWWRLLFLFYFLRRDGCNVTSSGWMKVTPIFLNIDSPYRETKTS